MTPATSVSFFRSEFDDFLYAAIDVDSNESPLSVLSAFARLNLDPWQDAAKLEKMIARLPSGRWDEAELGAIAERLIALLPRLSTAAEKGLKGPHGGSILEDGLAWIRSLFRR
jgi:hypothetical protein